MIHPGFFPVSTGLTAKGIIAMLVGYAAAVVFTINAVRKTRLLWESVGWFSVRGRILESRILPDPSGRGTHFRVRYEFVAGGRVEGGTPRLCGDWFWRSGLQAEFVARYIPGQEVEVYYDPRDPERNCLDRTDWSGVYAMWIIASGAFFLASVLLWLSVGDLSLLGL